MRMTEVAELEGNEASACEIGALRWTFVHFLRDKAQVAERQNALLRGYSPAGDRGVLE